MYACRSHLSLFLLVMGIIASITLTFNQKKEIILPSHPIMDTFINMRIEDGVSDTLLLPKGEYSDHDNINIFVPGYSDMITKHI